MTKKQYLTKLANCIQALPQDEQKEALDYYSNYFDESQSVQSAIDELGTPEELAKSIIEKMACVPSRVKKTKKSERQNDENFDEKFDTEFEQQFEDENLFFKFSENNVKNLGIALGACHVVMKTGSEYKVETRGILRQNFRCEINQAGTLIIENVKMFPRKHFSNQNKKSHWYPRILITIPNSAYLENFKLTIEAGKFESKKIDLSVNKFMIDAKACELILDGIKSNASIINASMGSVVLKSILRGITKIDAAMGAVKIQLLDELKNYSFEARASLATVKFNKTKVGGLNQVYSEDRKSNHFIISARMGDVFVKSDDF